MSIYETLQKEWLAYFNIKTDAHGNILLHSPYYISPLEEEDLLRLYDSAICCS
jgi:hypothetical protein